MWGVEGYAGVVCPRAGVTGARADVVCPRAGVDCALIEACGCALEGTLGEGWGVEPPSVPPPSVPPPGSLSLILGMPPVGPAGPGEGVIEAGAGTGAGRVEE